jgi:hypothetical protein
MATLSAQPLGKSSPHSFPTIDAQNTIHTPVSVDQELPANTDFHGKPVFRRNSPQTDQKHYQHSKSTNNGLYPLFSSVSQNRSIDPDRRAEVSFFQTVFRSMKP